MSLSLSRVKKRAISHLVYREEKNMLSEQTFAADSSQCSLLGDIRLQLDIQGHVGVWWLSSCNLIIISPLPALRAGNGRPK